MPHGLSQYNGDGWGYSGRKAKAAITKRLFQTARGGGEGTRRGGLWWEQGIYGIAGVLGEMTYRLCVVESSGGNDPPAALLVCHAGSRRLWGL